MSENPTSTNERPCLHCLIGDLIDEFYAEYGTTTGETDVIDIDETLSALAKTVADLTHGSDAAARQLLGEHRDGDFTLPRPGTGVAQELIDRRSGVGRGLPVPAQPSHDVGGDQVLRRHRNPL